MLNATVEVPKDMKPSRFSVIQPWLVCFSAALFFFFEFMQVNMFNAMDPYFIRAFNISTTELGTLSAAYFMTNVFFLLPAGIILDRVSTRKLIVVAMIACVGSTYLFSLSTALWQAEVCRLITGIGGAFCLLSCVKLASRWFPPHKLAFVVGLIVTFAMVGGMIAQTPFAIAINHFGWRDTLALNSGLGAVMLVVIAIFVKDFPPGQEKLDSSQHHQLHEKGFWWSLRKVTGSLQTWLGGIYASLINIPIFILGATWGSMFLVQVHNFSRDQSTMITSMIFLGMIFGSPFFGWISDHLLRRKMPMIIGALLSIVSMLAIMFVPSNNFWLFMLMFLVLGFVIGSQIIAYPLVAESNPASLTGTAEGMASVLIMSGGFMIPLFPLLLNVDWAHVYHNRIPFYSSASYHLGLWIMPIGFVIALLASLLIRETRCKSYEQMAEENA